MAIGTYRKIITLNVNGLNAPTQMHQHSNYRDPRRRKEIGVWENFWRDFSWKFPQHGKGNSQSSPRGTKSPIQVKPKEKHVKTHINQTNKA